MTTDLLLDRLRAASLVEGEAVRVRPLTGGVSSEVIVVETPERRFVVKTALARLSVRDEWFADVSRNAVEREYLEFAARVVPGAVPKILGGNSSEGWFAMEWIDERFRNWKTLLLANDAQLAHARKAGDILGRLHRASWGSESVRERFATLPNFHALRIEPYLLTTASRMPEARPALDAEAQRLAATQLALVHGDYSPKNLLVADNDLVVLDAECGWFGDPAFDTAFLLNHLHLKALLHAPNADPMLSLVPAFWSAYAAAAGSCADAALEARTVRLLLCLMLARVHGKSPAEYLTTAAQRDLITDFVLSRLSAPPDHVAHVTASWRSELARL